MTTQTVRPTPGSADRYLAEDPDVLLSGMQALVRIPLEQRKRDLNAGHDVATLVSGYEGSPLAGFDLEMQRREALLTEARVVLRPALNEELGANAVQGSQLASASDDGLHDGVIGIWYGKAPGLDRSSDAIRHGNLGGADHRGGVLVLVGDDATAKSSTVPSSSEMAMAELGMPVLVPANPRDILELGLHGIALSRFCGLWTGVKLATSVVDGGETTDVRPGLIHPVLPSRAFEGADFRHEVSADFLQPNLGKLEASANRRIELATRYARANRLNTIHGDRQARVGIVAAGPTYLAVRRALDLLGHSGDLVGSGIRLLKLAMVSPMDTETLDEFADGLDEIVVVEDKRAFVELLVKDHLYGRPSPRIITGRRSDDGSAQFPTDGELTVEIIARVLRGRLERTGIDCPVPARPSQSGRGRVLLPLATRTAYFCSGCPHNRSTEVPEGSLVGAGIGCSGLLTTMAPERVGDVVGFAQMGGEGALWTGMSPFVRRPHFIQNMGDGTFHHSGSLAIRAAIAAGVSITYKILYNDVVAMTGGQAAVGKLSVPEIAQELLVEGVARAVVVTDDVRKHRRRALPKGVAVRHRDQLVQVQEELAAVTGVTVIIYDQECATELRRKRKRGLTPDRTTRAFINERVCEGCGDCGAKSNCLSVQPIDTDLGRKTTIHQSSCNKDYSCFDGECPSFLSIEPATGKAKHAHAKPLADSDLPHPRVRSDQESVTVRMTGVGGTGIVTLAQILSVAGRSEGCHVQTLDQLGLAQKGGAVVSDVRLSRSPSTGPNRISDAECDVYLGCDLLVAADPTLLKVTSSERTGAVVSVSKVPTGGMVTDTGTAYPEVDALVDRIESVTRSADLVSFSAIEAAVRLFGSDQSANILLLGAAVQAGLLPLAPRSVEAAIEANGVAVETNVQAFRRGRQVVADRAAFDLVAAPPHQARLESDALGRQLAERLPDGTDPEIRRLVGARSSDLVRYQNRRYAQRYADDVATVARAEADQAGSVGIVTDQFARGLHKLMAYKDEYEVARLSIDPELLARIDAEFGPGARVAYRLHPPVLKMLGLKHKVSLGKWFRWVFRFLYAMRFLRGTPFDLFGIGEVRRTERRLVREYRAGVLQSLVHLRPKTTSLVSELAGSPDIVRGYEHVKMANIVKYEAEFIRIQHELAESAVQSIGS